MFIQISKQVITLERRKTITTRKKENFTLESKKKEWEREVILLDDHLEDESDETTLGRRGREQDEGG